jgi:uncharacterized protein YjbJ (UPF0337 family)
MAGKVDKAKGRGKRAVGEATGKKGLKGRGSIDKAAGRAKRGVDETADKAKGTVRRTTT